MNLIILIMMLFIVWPLHKICHCIPLWLVGKRASLSIERSNKPIPIIYTNIPGTTSKRLAIIMSVFPGVVITAVIFVAASQFPSMLYYLSFAGALNFGISMKDFVYLTHLAKAPTHAYIEDDRDDCRILIKQTL
ncbi:putative zincin peptidase [Scopulibacillus darangshiensis]|uniref:Putative zincin peptidase n=2 Tax=Scopulibacillus darangshiensis TaxID=442528 RepID=A0A4R2P3T3_9BACL|nr:putative zincin peptidase [Scopulibacillus darangshiensis]